MVCITSGAHMEAPLKATVWFGGAIVRGAAALEVRTSTRLCAGLSLAQALFMSTEQAGCVKRGHGCLPWMCLEDTARLFSQRNTFFKRYYEDSFIIAAHKWPRTFQHIIYVSSERENFIPKRITYTSVSIATHLNGLASCSPQMF